MKEIKIENLNVNPFTLIGKEWCLIGAKKGNDFNAMTASWGSVGVLWNKNIVTIYVRPQRYTKEFLDAQDYFTLSFFDESYKKALAVYGSESGRDINKEEKTGLTRFDDGDYTYLEEAKLVIECKKMYVGEILPSEMLDASIELNYPNKDYHFIYIGEIKKVLEK